MVFGADTGYHGFWSWNRLPWGLELTQVTMGFGAERGYHGAWNWYRLPWGLELLRCLTRIITVSVETMTVAILFLPIHVALQLCMWKTLQTSTPIMTESINFHSSIWIANKQFLHYGIAYIFDRYIGSIISINLARICKWQDCQRCCILMACCSTRGVSSYLEHCGWLLSFQSCCSFTSMHSNTQIITIGNTGNQIWGSIPTETFYSQHLQLFISVITLVQSAVRIEKLLSRSAMVEHSA